MICSTCKKDKPVTAFGVSKTYASGYNPRCKECCNISAKKHYAKRTQEIQLLRTLLQQNHQEAA